MRTWLRPRRSDGRQSGDADSQEPGGVVPQGGLVGPDQGPAWGAARVRNERVLDWAVGGLVLVVCAITQLAFLLGPHPFDPAKYFRTALDFPDVPVDLFTLRFGLVVPVRVAIFVLGPSEAALYAVPLLAGLVLAGAVYATMLLLFGDRVVAAAAALVTVLNTSYLLNASSIFPDTVATATFTAGFLLLVLGWRGSGEEEEGWAPWVFVAGAGLLFGWTYLIREFSFVLVPAVLAAALLMRYSVRRIGLLAGVFLATAALQVLYGALLYERPLVHAQRLLGRSDTQFSPARGVRMEHIQGQLNNPFDTLIVFPRLLVSWQVGWVLLLFVGILAVGLVRFRDRRLWVLAVWCFGFWAFMAAVGLGTLPSGRWVLNITNVRYWSPILPALVMGAFGTVFLLLRSSIPDRRGVLATQAVAVLLAALALVPGFVEFSNCADKDVWRNDPAERWDDLRSWFAGPEAQRYDRVLTDGHTHRLLPAFVRSTFGDTLWRGRVRKFADPSRTIDPQTNLDRSLILIHIDRFRSLPGAQRTLDRLRVEWSPVFETGDERMIVLAHSSATVGEAPATERPWWELSTYAVRGSVPRGCGLSPYEPPA